ncbi:Copper-transporting ATPase 1 [Nymphon striatum]|nr:Copper-transporting ATPase 1 [Nymphon striatum]
MIANLGNYKRNDGERRTVRILVAGMMGNPCIQLIEDNVKQLPGIIDIETSFEERIVTVDLMEEFVTADEVLDCIDNLGFDTDLIDDGDSDLDEYLHQADTLVMDVDFLQLESTETSSNTKIPFVLPYDEISDSGNEEPEEDLIKLKKILFKIDEISGTSSTFLVERNLLQVEGVKHCHVCLLTGETEVEYDENKVKVSEISTAITNMGFKSQLADEFKPNNHTIFIRIDGMSKAATAEIVEKSILMMNGIKSVSMNFPNKYARVTYDTDETGPRSIIGVIQDCGLHASLESNEKTSSRRSAINVKRSIKASTSEMKLMQLQAREGLLVEQSEQDSVFTDRRVKAELVETGDLLKVQPGFKIPVDGNIIAGSSSVDESLLTGDSISVLKTDGSQVIGGSINQEGVLFMRATRVGTDTVLSKIISLVKNAQNCKAPIQKKIAKIFCYYLVAIFSLAFLTFSIWMIVGFGGSRILERIGFFQFDKLKGESVFRLAFTTTICVLVITYPYVLVLSTSIAMRIGCGVAAVNGILIRTERILECSSQVTTIVFDKRGILTAGQPSVSSIRLLVEEDVLSMKLFFAIIDIAERNCSHPIAKAITKFVQRILGGHTFGTSTLYKYSSGNGIKCKVSDIDFENLELQSHQERNIDEPDQYYEVQCFGDVPTDYLPEYTVKKLEKNQSFEVLIGNREWMIKNGLAVTQEVNRRMEDCEIHGETAVLVAINNTLIAVITLEDLIKPEAALEVNKLKQYGLDVILLTGDGKLSSNYAAKKVGLDKVFSNLSPIQKCEKIKEIQNSGAKVAMIGDGINDSAALIQSDVGIFVGIGSDYAMKEAEIILLKKDLSDILTFIDLSKSTMRRITCNTIAVILYAILVLPIAAGICLPIHFVMEPWMACIIMCFVSLGIICSSLHLQLYKPPSISNPSFSRLHRSRFEGDPGCRNPVYRSSEDLRIASRLPSSVEDLKKKGLPTFGKKAELIERLSQDNVEAADSASQVLSQLSQTSFVKSRIATAQAEARSLKMMQELEMEEMKVKQEEMKIKIEEKNLKIRQKKRRIEIKFGIGKVEVGEW